ncbi:hypothetical protein [Janthinobacterium tructae]
MTLDRYAASGTLPINRIAPTEKVIRQIAICKRNWLFTGSEQVARLAVAS